MRAFRVVAASSRAARRHSTSAVRVIPIIAARSAEQLKNSEELASGTSKFFLGLATVDFVIAVPSESVTCALTGIGLVIVSAAHEIAAAMHSTERLRLEATRDKTP